MKRTVYVSLEACYLPVCNTTFVNIYSLVVTNICGRKRRATSTISGPRLNGAYISKTAENGDNHKKKWYIITFKNQMSEAVSTLSDRFVDYCRSGNMMS